MGEESDIITPHEQWLALGRDGDARRAAYRALFDEIQKPAEFEAVRFGSRTGLPVGSQNFKRQVEESLCIKLGTGKRGRQKKKKEKKGSGSTKFSIC